MWLDAIYESLRQEAAAALERGDWELFFACGLLSHDNVSMCLWQRNKAELTKLGVYEESLLHAWSCQEYAGEWTLTMLLAMLASDRAKFAGLAPLPAAAVEPDGKVTVYRGVGRPTRKDTAMFRRSLPRRWNPPIERGLSWTLDIETAKRFAVRIYGKGVVLKMRLDPEAVWAYVDARQEHECLIPLFPKKAKIQIVQKFEKADVIGAASAHR